MFCVFLYAALIFNKHFSNAAIKNWQTDGKGLYASKDGSISTAGEWKVPSTGFYVCAAQLRMDDASRGYYFRVIVSLNSDKDVNTGMD